jgi:ribonucleoside-diphosphate reductase alpha chain
MQNNDYGPKLPISEEIHARKHRLIGETFKEACTRVASALTENKDDFYNYRQLLLTQAFLPGGRIQSSVGSPRKTTAFNCFGSGDIGDSMDEIMESAAEAAQTMRLGGGIGYCFSTLRPKNDLIVSLDSKSSGPVSFMKIFDAVCDTISSAGHRRGAQMGVMHIWHPDIEEFIEAKCNSTTLTRFNISVAVTDEFMQCVVDGKEYELRFGGRVYKKVSARYLWDKLMRATWDWAEPGILFIDRINEENNLYYCETISLTNPCGEQPLPPYGACLLGSFNLVKYITEYQPKHYRFDWDKFIMDIPVVIRAQDNVIDATVYPLPQHKVEAELKRRMGIGITGLANAGERLGYPYGSTAFLAFARKVGSALANTAYSASADIAREKGAFPLYDEEKYLNSKFISRLSPEVKEKIRRYGIRNSHLISIAPTGTISLGADNVSSGCEPVFSHYYHRTIINDNNEPEIELVTDYGYREWGLEGRTAAECSIDDHVNVMLTLAKWVDSSISKTINIGSHVTWEEFKDIYMRVWQGGGKGCTTFRADGKRYGILNVDNEAGAACVIDTQTGIKTCDS